jgi:hypothetical protein
VVGRTEAYCPVLGPARFAIIHPMRRVALAVLFTLPVVACKKKPDPAELAARAASASAASAPAAVPAGSGASLLSNFEGRIKLAAKGKLDSRQDKPMALDLALLVKDGKLRADLPPGMMPGPDQGPVYVLVEPEAQKLYAVMAAKKQALLVDVAKLAPQLEAMAKNATGGAGGAGAPGAKSPSTGTRTGRTDKVAGFPCEIWDVKHGTQKLELCVHADEKPWLKVPAAALPPQLSWAKELADGRHFPLRYVAFDADGKESGRVELTSVERTALPAADFEVPKGFVIVSFDQVMTGLGGLMGGGAGGIPALKNLPPGFKLPPGMALPPGNPSTKP